MSGVAYPWLLPWAALCVAGAGVAGLLWLRRRRRVAAALADPRLAALIAPGLAASRTRPVLWLLASVALGAAALGPIIGTEEASGRTGLPDVALVMDASNSMLVEDVLPSRLEAERRVARELVRRLGGTRAGLVVFAGQGYVVSPLTRDVSALDAYLEALAPEMVPQGGSSLSAALRQGGGLLGPAASRGIPGALVLMTDGDALEEGAEVDRVAQLLAEARIPVHVVAVGTRGGGRIPDVDPESGRRIGFKKEPDGREARSTLGEALLRALAKRTGGSYVTASAGAPDELLRALPVALDGPRAWNERRPSNRYPWLVAAAVLLLMADSVLAARAARRRGP